MLHVNHSLNFTTCRHRRLLVFAVRSAQTRAGMNLHSRAALLKKFSDEAARFDEERGVDANNSSLCCTITKSHQQALWLILL
jgi:hypothetical protein